MTEISNQPMWRFLKRKHAKNSDEVSDEIPQSHDTSDEETQAPDNSTALVVQQRAERRSVYTMEVIYQWSSHGPIIQAVLFN